MACHVSSSSASLKGLARSSDLDDYCYYVGRVVAKCSTDLLLRLFSGNRRPSPALSAIAASLRRDFRWTE